MSKPRYWWYGNVKKAISVWSRTKDRQETGYRRIDDAVTRALHDLDKEPYADEKKQAIMMVLIKGTHTIDGAEYELHFSRPTIQRWINSFVNRVGAYMGYDGGK